MMTPDEFCLQMSNYTNLVIDQVRSSKIDDFLVVMEEKNRLIAAYREAYEAANKDILHCECGFMFSNKNICPDCRRAVR
jgi:hypothetical protein